MAAVAVGGWFARRFAGRIRPSTGCGKGDGCGHSEERRRRSRVEINVGERNRAVAAAVAVVQISSSNLFAGSCTGAGRRAPRSTEFYSKHGGWTGATATHCDTGGEIEDGDAERGGGGGGQRRPARSLETERKRRLVVAALPRLARSPTPRFMATPRSGGALFSAATAATPTTRRGDAEDGKRANRFTFVTATATANAATRRTAVTHSHSGGSRVRLHFSSPVETASRTSHLPSEGDANDRIKRRLFSYFFFLFFNREAKRGNESDRDGEKEKKKTKQPKEKRITRVRNGARKQRRRKENRTRTDGQPRADGLGEMETPCPLPAHRLLTATAYWRGTAKRETNRSPPRFTLVTGPSRHVATRRESRKIGDSALQQFFSCPAVRGRAKARRASN